MNDPVVTADGLVGLVTRVTPDSSRVQLLTDEEAAASAIDLRTGATGIVRHARGTRETLVFDRVGKQDLVRVGNEIVTAGWRAGALSSLFPKGIPIGRVTSVGQTDTDLFQQVQVDPYVDFGSLDAVLVLVPATAAMTRGRLAARVRVVVRRGDAAGRHRLVDRRRRRCARPPARHRRRARAPARLDSREPFSASSAGSSSTSRRSGPSG